MDLALPDLTTSKPARARKLQLAQGLWIQQLTIIISRVSVFTLMGSPHTLPFYLCKFLTYKTEKTSFSWLHTFIPRGVARQKVSYQSQLCLVSCQDISLTITTLQCNLQCTLHCSAPLHCTTTLHCTLHCSLCLAPRASVHWRFEAKIAFHSVAVRAGRACLLLQLLQLLLVFLPSPYAFSLSAIPFIFIFRFI